MPIFEYVCTKCEHRFEALTFRKPESGLSQVQEQGVGATAFGVCGVGQRLGAFCRILGSGWRMRLVWRSARGGGVFHAGF